jgi:predicted nucleotidyltransferase
MKHVQSFRANPQHRDLINKLLKRIDQGDAETIATLLDCKPVGPFKDAESACQALTGRLVSDLGPEQIWLFGSRARGEEKQEADFDLLVVLPNEHSAVSDYMQVASPVVGFGIGCDVVPCSSSEFAEGRAGDGSLIGTVKQEGRRLYASPKIRRDERRLK